MDSENEVARARSDTYGPGYRTGARAALGLVVL